MIRQLLRIIRQVDVPPAEVASKFIELERADAEDVQKKLEDILTKQNQQQAPGAVATTRLAPAQRVATTPDGQPLPPGANAADAASTIEISAGGPNEENIIQGKIKITADKRTNRIFVVTRPENMPFVEKLIREFDANVRFGEPTVRPLKYVSAGEILAVAIKAISDPGAKEGADAGANAGGAPRPGGQGSRQGSGGSLFGNNSNNDGFGGGGGGGGGGGSSTMILVSSGFLTISTTLRASPETSA
jgi:uncharacterized membrane protein YgcG